MQQVGRSFSTVLGPDALCKAHEMYEHFALVVCSELDPTLSVGDFRTRMQEIWDRVINYSIKATEKGMNRCGASFLGGVVPRLIQSQNSEKLPAALQDLAKGCCFINAPLPEGERGLVATPFAFFQWSKTPAALPYMQKIGFSVTDPALELSEQDLLFLRQLEGYSQVKEWVEQMLDSLVAIPGRRVASGPFVCIVRFLEKIIRNGEWEGHDLFIFDSGAIPIDIDQKGLLQGLLDGRDDVQAMLKYLNEQPEIDRAGVSCCMEALKLLRSLIHRIESKSPQSPPSAIGLDPNIIQASHLHRLGMQACMRLLSLQVETGKTQGAQFPGLYVCLLYILFHLALPKDVESFLGLLNTMLSSDGSIKDYDAVSSTFDGEIATLVGGRPGILMLLGGMHPPSQQALQLIEKIFLRNIPLVQNFGPNFNQTLGQAWDVFFDQTLPYQPAEAFSLSACAKGELQWAVPLKWTIPKLHFDIWGKERELEMLSLKVDPPPSSSVPQQRRTSLPFKMELPPSSLLPVGGAGASAIQTFAGYLDDFQLLLLDGGFASISVLALRGKGGFALYFQLPEGSQGALHPNLQGILHALGELLGDFERFNQLLEEIKRKEIVDRKYDFLIPPCNTKVDIHDWEENLARAFGEGIPRELNIFSDQSKNKIHGMNYQSLLVVDDQGSSAAAAATVWTLTAGPGYRVPISFFNSLMVVVNDGRPDYLALFPETR